MPHTDEKIAQTHDPDIVKKVEAAAKEKNINGLVTLIANDYNTYSIFNYLHDCIITCGIYLADPDQKSNLNDTYTNFLNELLPKVIDTVLYYDDHKALFEKLPDSVLHIALEHALHIKNFAAAQFLLDKLNVTITQEILESIAKLKSIEAFESLTESLLKKINNDKKLLHDFFIKTRYAPWLLSVSGFILSQDIFIWLEKYDSQKAIPHTDRFISHAFSTKQIAGLNEYFISLFAENMDDANSKKIKDFRKMAYEQFQNALKYRKDEKKLEYVQWVISQKPAIFCKSIEENAVKTETDSEWQQLIQQEKTLQAKIAAAPKPNLQPTDEKDDKPDDNKNDANKPLPSNSFFTVKTRTLIDQENHTIKFDNGIELRQRTVGKGNCLDHPVENQDHSLGFDFQMSAQLMDTLNTIDNENKKIELIKVTLDAAIMKLGNKINENTDISTKSGAVFSGPFILRLNEDEIVIFTIQLGDCGTRLIQKDSKTTTVTNLNQRVHTPDDKNETDRIKKTGGRIFNGRVEGDLLISRAFGDTGLRSQNQSLIICKPDIDVKRISLKTSGTLDVLSGSDGLLVDQKHEETLGINNAAIAQRIHLGEGNNLHLWAKKKGSGDDITFIETLGLIKNGVCNLKIGEGIFLCAADGHGYCGHEVAKQVVNNIDRCIAEEFALVDTHLKQLNTAPAPSSLPSPNPIPATPPATKDIHPSPIHSASAIMAAIPLKVSPFAQGNSSVPTTASASTPAPLPQPATKKPSLNPSSQRCQTSCRLM